nr:MAG TPA: hypothetical protein [Caudoviricetes sp.]
MILFVRIRPNPSEESEFIRNHSTTIRTNIFKPR